MPLKEAPFVTVPRFALSVVRMTPPAGFPSPSVQLTNGSIFSRVHWPVHSVRSAAPKCRAFTHGHAIESPPAFGIECAPTSAGDTP